MGNGRVGGGGEEGGADGGVSSWGEENGGDDAVGVFGQTDWDPDGSVCGVGRERSCVDSPECGVSAHSERDCLSIAGGEWDNRSGATRGCIGNAPKGRSACVLSVL